MTASELLVLLDGTVLLAPVFFVLFQLWRWIRAEVDLKEEELRGMKAHHRQHLNGTYEEEA